jgi:hypothetical protein
MAETGIVMKRRIRLRAIWINPGSVAWGTNIDNWAFRGEFDNCVSMQCLVERVRRIIKAPRRPPRYIYGVAESALGYLFGMINDFNASRYEVGVGVNIGAADAYDGALANAVLAKLAPGHRASRSGGKFPELFLHVELTYDVYDCGGEICEGWWAEVTARYDLPGELCIVTWSRYMAPDIETINKDAIRRAAYKALRHAYNTPIVKLT